MPAVSSTHEESNLQSPGELHPNRDVRPVQLEPPCLQFLRDIARGRELGAAECICPSAIAAMLCSSAARRVIHGGSQAGQAGRQAFAQKLRRLRA